MITYPQDTTIPVRRIVWRGLLFVLCLTLHFDDLECRTVYSNDVSSWGIGTAIN